MFIENKGLVTDQDGLQRNDVLYCGSADDLVYHFRNTGISYRLYEKGKGEDLLVSSVDMNWIGASSQAAVLTDHKGTYKEHFYTGAGEGIINVQSFGDLQCESIYDGVDLRYYYKNGSLKYDFIVAAGADYRTIRIQVNGIGAIQRLKDRTVTIATPNGNITEGMPVAFQNGRELKTSWILQDNVLSFEVAGYDPRFRRHSALYLCLG